MKGSLLPRNFTTKTHVESVWAIPISRVCIYLGRQHLDGRFATKKEFLRDTATALAGSFVIARTVGGRSFMSLEH